MNIILESAWSVEVGEQLARIRAKVCDKEWAVEWIDRGDDRATIATALRSLADAIDGSVPDRRDAFPTHAMKE